LKSSGVLVTSEHGAGVKELRKTNRKKKVLETIRNVG
jgi:hypothetical protein